MADEGSIDEIVARPYARVLVPEESGGWNAEILELQGCFTGGATKEEALQNLDEVHRLWVDVKLDEGAHIPDPLEASSHNGRILLRIPKTVHRAASMIAKAEGVSLNQWVASLINQRIGAGDALEALAALRQRVTIREVDIERDILTFPPGSLSGAAENASPDFAGSFASSTIIAEVKTKETR